MPKYREISGLWLATEQDITNLITDLLHHAHDRGIDTQAMLVRADLNFKWELSAKAKLP